MASMMNIIQKPTATVGQVVRDLELIVAKNPDLSLEYCNDDGNDMFVEGVRLRKNFAILETTGKESRAATAEEILAMLRMLDASVGVVLQDGWELLDFEPNADGIVISSDDEEGYSLFTLGRNVQLVTTQQLEAELKERCGEDDLARKLAPVTKSPKAAHYVNSVQWHYGKLCLCYNKEEQTDSITVASLLEAFPICAEFMVRINGRYYTVDAGDEGIFFGFKKGDERYLGIRIGEMVYDPSDY